MTNLNYSVKRIKNRIIYIPCPELMDIQRFYLKLIKSVYPNSADTLEAAKSHVGKYWILKMDIKNFFESVPKDEIKKVCNKISKLDSAQYPQDLLLCFLTLKGILPVGAPTSPCIANACFKDIDEKINLICSAKKVNYTRYVDDLTFSSDDKKVLNIIEKNVSELLNYAGYKLNRKKTRYISKNKQQNILGLIVNDNKIRLSKEFKRTIRAMIHSYIISISEKATKELKHCVWTIKEYKRLRGYLSYIKHVDNSYFNLLKNYFSKLELKYDTNISLF